MAVFHFDQKNKWLLLYTVPWLLAALGFLTKGFPSPLFVGFTYLGWFGFRQKWRALFHPAHALGLLLFGLITGAYFYVYSLQADLPHYLSGLFDQSSQRTAGEHASGELLPHMLLFFPDSLKNILPASLLLPLLAFRSVRKALAQHPILIFCGLALAANVWIYWISPGSRPRYVYMLYPLAILPLAWAYYTNAREQGRGPFRVRNVLNGLAIGLSWLLPLGIMATPAIMVLAGEAVSWLTWAVCAGGGGAAAAMLYYSHSRMDALARLLLLTVLARLAFDALVLPERAIQGEAPKWKTHGQLIAEQSNGQPLRILGTRDAGNFPLATAYYIEREREEVLSCDQIPEPGIWYLAEPHQIDTSKAIRHGGFTWKAFEFGLYEYSEK